MINLIIQFALISHSFAQTPTEAADNTEITYVDFEDVSVDGVLVGPRLTLVTLKPTAKPDLLIPDVRQLFIDKNGKRVTPSNK